MEVDLPLPRRFRDTASFGRRHEYVVAAELLRRGFDVYMTLVDDQGIDCIVRLDEHRYLDIQIKARSVSAKHWNRFARMSFDPRSNLYFILFTEKSNRLWVIPSVSLAKLARRNLSGRNVGCMSVDLPRSAAGKAHDMFKCFEGEQGFQLLRKHKRKAGARRHRL